MRTIFLIRRQNLIFIRKSTQRYNFNLNNWKTNMKKYKNRAFYYKNLQEMILYANFAGC